MTMALPGRSSVGRSEREGDAATAATEIEAAASRSRPMTAFAMYAADEALRVANQRLAELRRESENQRLVAGRRRPHRLLLDTVRAALSSLRSGLKAVDGAPLATPRLADYPYRI
jgi:hypothetical protein